MSDVRESIQDLHRKIISDFGYSVRLCGEIEFAFAHRGAVPDCFWQALMQDADNASIGLQSIGREQTGLADIQQYECRFNHTDPLAAAEAINWLNIHIEKLSQAYGIKILFFNKSNDCSVYNGLHWHLHMLDHEEQYCFFKQDDQLSASLAHTLGGLLETMPALMRCFAPTEASFQRLCSGADHIPTCVSWGGNNRSVALRLPESVVPHRHIEHRLCGSDVNPFAAVWALLVGVHYGLKHQPELPPQCYGDARRSDLPPLPQSSEEIVEAEWLRDYGAVPR